MTCSVKVVHSAPANDIIVGVEDVSNPSSQHSHHANTKATACRKALNMNMQRHRLFEKGENVPHFAQ